MNTYSNKLLNGETPSLEDWREYLKEAHRASRSMTPQAFEKHKTNDGINSYQFLANQLRDLEATPKRVLDLACGDGHLAPYIQKSAGNSVEIVGVDMSESELEVARRKQLGPRVAFKCETADSISEPDSSFDAILCHMAFMLMNPIDPVVKEIHRTLKPSGLFAAIIGSGKLKDDFYANFRSLLDDFIKEKYPSFGKVVTGDPQVRSNKQIFKVFESHGLKDMTSIDFDLPIKDNPEGIWDFFKDTYLVSSFPEVDRAELGERVLSAARREQDEDGQVHFTFPMRLLKSRKRL